MFTSNLCAVTKYKFRPFDFLTFVSWHQSPSPEGNGVIASVHTCACVCTSESSYKVYSVRESYGARDLFHLSQGQSGNVREICNVEGEIAVSIL